MVVNQSVEKEHAGTLITYTIANYSDFVNITIVKHKTEAINPFTDGYSLDVNREVQDKSKAIAKFHVPKDHPGSYQLCVSLNISQQHLLQCSSTTSVSGESGGKFVLCHVKIITWYWCPFNRWPLTNMGRDINSSSWCSSRCRNFYLHPALLLLWEMQTKVLQKSIF